MPKPDLQRRVAQARYETDHGSKKRATKLWKRARKAAIQLIRSGYTVPQICDEYGVSRQWVHIWWKRWLAGGKAWAALEGRSSRPHKIRTKRHEYVKRVLEGRDEHEYGAHKLQHVLGLKGELSHTTINEILRQAGRVQPQKKRRRKNWTRFQRSQPNHLWQLDVTQWVLNDGEGPKVWILSAIDDHSRFLLGSRVHEQELNAGDTVRFLRSLFKLWGRPRSILTDNGSEFANSGNVLSLVTQFLYKVGVGHITTSPQWPRCIGKIERWHRSLKSEWLRRRPAATTIDELRGVLFDWLDHYNSVRPHWALQLETPLSAYSGGFIPEHGFRRFVNDVA